MPNTNPDSTSTNVGSHLTHDKGLGYDEYPAEQIKYIYYISYDKLKVAGTRCEGFDVLPKDVWDLDTPETKAQFKTEVEKRFQTLRAEIFWLRNISTSCLLKASVAFNQLLLIFRSLPDEKNTYAVADTLVGIFNEVEKRTKAPYQFSLDFNKGLFKPLPQKLLTEFPLDQSGIWKQQCQRRRPIAGRGKKAINGGGLIPLVEKDESPVDWKDLDIALEVAEANVRITQELANTPPGDTPRLNDYKENLKKLTLVDVFKQTGVTIKNRADWRLSQLVEVIYYVSCKTLVLDKNGEPFDGNGIHGLFPYSMILNSKKHETVRFIPPKGRYVSLGPLADQQFSITGGIVRKLPIEYQGILAYQELDVTGQWEPDYQVEANKVLSRNTVYMGSLVVESAFAPKNISLTSMVTILPTIVEETMPYFYRVVSKKIESWF